MNYSVFMLRFRLVFGQSKYTLQQAIRFLIKKTITDEKIQKKRDLEREREREKERNREREREREKERNRERERERERTK